MKKLEHKVEQPPSVTFVPRGYMVEELAVYDGKQRPQAFLGVKGVIYNVSLEWYGPEGPYSAFAGCDCSRQLGKVVVSREEINADWTTLSTSHLQVLHEWEERMRSKYPVVGWVIDPAGDFVKRAAQFTP